MTDLRELKSLDRHYRDRPYLSGALAEYCRTPEYCAKLTALSKDPAVLARLAIALLSHMALDPLTGNRAEHFVRGLEGAEGSEVWVSLSFHRVINILGSFFLPRDLPETTELLAAVEANLNGRLFKAATIHRRIERGTRRSRLLTRAATRAGNERARILTEGLTPSAMPKYEYEQAAYREALYSQAQSAYDAIYEPRYAQIQGRLRALGAQAYTSDFRGAYTDILIAFAQQYVYPLVVASDIQHNH